MPLQLTSINSLCFLSDRRISCLSNLAQLVKAHMPLGRVVNADAMPWVKAHSQGWLSESVRLEYDCVDFQVWVKWPCLSVQEELTECNRDREVSGVFITLHDGANISHLTGTIAGPADSPYEGGTFTIDIRLPGGYPFEPPKMQFVTKVWHPNISSQNGAICLDILKDQWSPALTLKTALLSLQALLSSPAPDDPQDAVVAQQYLRDYPTFAATARYWTEAFAKSASTGMEEKVQKLVEMGFPEDLVRSTLKSVDGDENLALEKLCSG